LDGTGGNEQKMLRELRLNERERNGGGEEGKREEKFEKV
jgi:hypothetical protein